MQTRPSLTRLQPYDGDATIVLDEIVRAAVNVNASDIHLEPKRDRMQVRLRIDGTMIDHRPVSNDVASQVTSRVKVLARMDIAERRLPQDGQLTLEVGLPTRTHLRASTFPTSQGEKVVLSASQAVLSAQRRQALACILSDQRVVIPAPTALPVQRSMIRAA